MIDSFENEIWDSHFITAAIHVEYIMVFMNIVSDMTGTLNIVSRDS